MSLAPGIVHHQLSLLTVIFTVVNLSAIDLDLLLVLDAVLNERSTRRAVSTLRTA